MGNYTISEERMLSRIKSFASKRGGYLLLLFDFLLLIISLLLIPIILVIDFFLGWFIGWKTVLFDLLILGSLPFLALLLIVRFYFCEIGKIETRIERLLLSIFNAVNIVVSFCIFSIIYSLFTEENSIYVIDSNSLIADAVFFLIVLIILHTIISLFMNTSFEAFSILYLLLVSMMKILESVVNTNWQVIMILYTLTILVLHEDNINLFAKKKIDAEKKEEIKAFISYLKVYVGIIPLSLYGGVSISNLYPIKILSSIGDQYNELISGAIYTISIFTVSLSMIQIVLMFLRKKLRD
ncbi:Uncharacterised protein [Streptococcus mitis]|uniref:Uncharacterized protein n=1 Tax=Streptococcus mitis TaxID=28037 RepID=A0A4U9ZWT3_STRMT|nr:hypothetical protein [Streptococcus mitis]VTS45415.1 Uncharacterised protein [Streptococcus mitis]